jgi:hypothetical protein
VARRESSSGGRSVKSSKRGQRAGAAGKNAGPTGARASGGRGAAAPATKARATKNGAAGPRAGRPRAAGRGPREAASSSPLVFFGREWAQAVKDAVNAGPSPEARAKKIERFWEWIEKAKKHVNCQLALAVDGLPGKGSRDCLLLTLENGRCVRARLGTRDDAEATATYLLAGGYGDWREIMGGFDMGKAVMYRKLLLEKGEVLEFFKSIYYWTESLACIQRIPTEFPTASSRAN